LRISRSIPTDGDAQRFAGVESISAGLFKARVVDLNLQYGGATWRNVDEWIAVLSRRSNFEYSTLTPGPNEALTKS
jgi:hypothetical protein